MAQHARMARSSTEQATNGATRLCERTEMAQFYLGCFLTTVKPEPEAQPEFQVLMAIQNHGQLQLPGDLLVLLLFTLHNLSPHIHITSYATKTRYYCTSCRRSIQRNLPSKVYQFAFRTLTLSFWSSIPFKKWSPAYQSTSHTYMSLLMSLAVIGEMHMGVADSHQRGLLPQVTKFSREQRWQILPAIAQDGNILRRVCSI